MDRRESPQSGAWVEILSSRDARAVAELALVLEAKAIPSIAERVGRESRLMVQAHDAQAALDELRDYESENARPRGGPRAIAFVGSGWPGVLGYIAILLVAAICVRQSLFGFDWPSAGRLDAGLVSAGQWWRSITALTLHADLGHLTGNAIFGGFFGYFVARYLGTGVGWAAILGSGALGNFVSAWLHSPDYRAIGASTAVFGALGILAAYTWRKGFLRNTPWRMRFAPITAGIGLLAFTGAGGENTDLGAHLFGFATGILTGLALARVKIPTQAIVQAAFGLGAAALLVLAWASALFAQRAAFGS